MGLFSALVGVTVDIVKAPVAVVKDAVTLGGAITGERSAIGELLEEIKRDAEKADD